MRIYTDFFTGTEIISDSYPFVQFADGAFVEIKSRNVVKGDVDVDVGCGNAFGGKNEDEEQQGGNSEVQKVIDLVDAFDLQSTTFDKKEWQKSFKAFLDRLLAQKKTEEEKAALTAAAKAYGKHVSTKWDDLEAYTPKDFDRENNVVFSYWKNQEDDAPTFIYFLAGCKSYKV